MQVLLSQCHRFRALVLLGRFLDMGPWAVDLVIKDQTRVFLFCFTNVFNPLAFIFVPPYPGSIMFGINNEFGFVGVVSWYFPLCPQALANYDSGTATDSCFHLDKDSGS